MKKHYFCNTLNLEKLESNGTCISYSRTFTMRELQSLITVRLNKIYSTVLRDRIPVWCVPHTDQKQCDIATPMLFSFVLSENQPLEGKRTSWETETQATTYSDLCGTAFPCVPQNPGLLWRNFKNKIFLVCIHKQLGQSPRSNLFPTQLCVLYKPVRIT
jgi:hypothetical protein